MSKSYIWYTNSWWERSFRITCNIRNNHIISLQYDWIIWQYKKVWEHFFGNVILSVILFGYLEFVEFVPKNRLRVFNIVVTLGQRCDGLTFVHHNSAVRVFRRWLVFRRIAHRDACAAPHTNYFYQQLFLTFAKNNAIFEINFSSSCITYYPIITRRLKITDHTIFQVYIRTFQSESVGIQITV